MDAELKSLLLIFNPKAGRSKPRGPLFDAVALLSGGGLPGAHPPDHRRRRRRGDRGPGRAGNTIWWWPPVEMVPSTR